MYHIKKRINFFDCDPAGIMFYGNIFHLCHSIYEELISSFNLEENYWDNEKYFVPIIHTESNYIKPIYPGDEVNVELTVSDLRTSSFELNYVIKNSKMETASEVKTVHIFVNKKEWNKISIPENIIKNLNAHRS